MTDLSKGILDFGEIVVTPDTAKEELLAVYGEKLSPASNNTFLDFNMLFSIEGQLFMCLFCFGKNNKIEYVELTPYITYKSEKWDRTGRQEERRQFCDGWLYEHLGEAPRNLGGAEYVFEGIRIATVTHFDQREGADAGYIVVRVVR